MKIIYPQTDIGAETAPSFLGRNGFFRASGIVISQPVPSIISIEPVTGKGQTGRCVIEIPAKRETISELIRELMRIESTLT